MKRPHPSSSSKKRKKKVKKTKAEKKVNKLLRDTTTPESVYAAFRQVYGDDVHASLSVEEDGQRLGNTSVANFILWTLEGPMKTNSPNWINLSNRPLVQHIIVVMIPGLDPRCLVGTPEQLPFLTTLTPKPLRVSQSGRQRGCTDSILRCSQVTGKNHNKNKKQSKGGKGGKGGQGGRTWGNSKTPPESFILLQRTKTVVIEDMEHLLSDGVQLFHDRNIIPDAGYVSTEGRTSSSASVHLAATNKNSSN